jgi:V8-like Glu-specific endopeptidase
MKALAIVGAAACASVALPWQSHATIFGADDRVHVSRAIGSPYSPIGILQFRAAGQSDNNEVTATLISPCHVLTNLHVVTRDYTTIDLENPPEARFYVGIMQTHPWRYVVRAVLVAHGAYQFDKGRQHEDWALFVLDRFPDGRCIGAEWGFIPLRVEWPDTLLSARLQMAGYPEDRTQDFGPWLDPNCRMMDADLRYMHDCAVRQGSSGSPILRVSADGSLTVVALHSGSTDMHDEVSIYPEWRRELTNYAAPVAIFEHRIRRHLENERAARPTR